MLISRCRTMSFLLLGLLPCAAFAQRASGVLPISGVNGLYYDTGDSTKPLIVAIPGFSEHHATPEFLFLERSFREAGYSYLVLDPPRHGPEGQESEGSYSYGDREPRKFLEILDLLGIWQHYPNVHMLGFSIGAKIAIEMGIFAEANGHSVRSVTAFAAPYTVEDINGTLSGSIAHPFESLASMCSATRRSNKGVCLAFDILPSLLCHTDWPASNIDRLTAPLLLVHTTDDWLTHVYHTLRLAPLASSSKHKEVVILRSYHHAEDIFSDSLSREAIDFASLYRSWVANASAQQARSSWTETAPDDDHFASAHEISRVPYQTYLDPDTWIWHTPSEYVPVPVSLDVARPIRTYDTKLQPLFNLGLGAQVTRKLGLRLDFGTYNAYSPTLDYVLTGSILYPIGSTIWLRRLSFTRSLTDLPRTISYTSIDAAFAIIDCSVNIGRLPQGTGTLISMDLPLITPGSGAYSLAAGLSADWTDMWGRRLMFHLLATGGPTIELLDARLRFSISASYWHDLHGFMGVAIYPGEFY